MANTPLHPERGNVFLMVFLGIVLVAALTVAIRGFDSGRDDVTQEDLTIKAAEAARYGAELENAVRFVIENGASEAEMRFSPPSNPPAEYGAIATTPAFQIFSHQGGNAEYRFPPAGVTTASSSGIWEFFGTTAIPDVGSDEAELVAVIPHVTAGFCAAVNRAVGLIGQPDDSVTGTTPDCVAGGSSDRFGSGHTFNTSPNVMDKASFSHTPATQGCVTCGAAYHYYYVLLAR